MSVSRTLKLRVKTAESVQPFIGTLDDPTYFAKTAALRLAASDNRCGNPRCVQRRRYLSWSQAQSA